MEYYSKLSDLEQGEFSNIACVHKTQSSREQSPLRAEIPMSTVLCAHSPLQQLGSTLTQASITASKGSDHTNEAPPYKSYESAWVTACHKGHTNKLAGIHQAVAKPGRLLVGRTADTSTLVTDRCLPCCHSITAPGQP